MASAILGWSKHASRMVRFNAMNLLSSPPPKLFRDIYEGGVFQRGYMTLDSRVIGGYSSNASRARDYSSDGLDVGTNANMMDPVKSFSGQSIGGKDVKTSMELSFLEAVQGCTKTVTFQTDVLCNTCGGSGVRSGTGPKTSEHCKGSGVTFVQAGIFRMEITCGTCKGTGKIVSSFCKSCKGAKVIKGTKSVKFDIIPGVDNGETIKVFKRGGADPDGDRPGHLYVAIKVRKDPVFHRAGYDIHVMTVISSTRALYGGTTYVPTLTGDVGVKVPRGTQHGEKLVLTELGEQVDIICVIRDTIQGKHGIKDKYSWHFGDLHVHFIVKSGHEKPDIEEFAKEAAGV